MDASKGARWAPADRWEKMDRYLVRARMGCPDSLGKLLDCCQGALYQVARRQIGPSLTPKIDPADLVQMTYVQAVRRFREFRGERGPQFLAWLMEILARQAADSRRRYLFSQKRSIEREVAWDERRYRALADRRAEERREAARRAEHLACVTRGLARLSREYRIVVELRARPLSWAKVGAELDRSAGAARLLFVRAVRSLRRELDPRPSLQPGRVVLP